MRDEVKPERMVHMEIVKDALQPIGEVSLTIRIIEPRSAKLICNPAEDVAAWIADHTEQLTAALKVWGLTFTQDTTAAPQSAQDSSQR
jgi:hypothetical protein